MGTGIRTMITHFPTAEKPSATEVSRRKRRRASVLGVTRRRMLRKYTAGARRRASAPAGSGTPGQVKTTGARRSIARRSVDRLSLLLSHVSVFDRRRRLHGEPPQETARGGEKPNKEKPKNLRQPPQGLERSRQRWSLPLAETARVGNVDKKTTAKKSVKMRLRMSFPGVGLARESRQASETVKMVQTKRERRATCEYDVCYKVLVMGETSVGKSSLIARLKGGMFADNLMPTCGIDFVNQDYEIDGAKCRLQVWDTAGQERFRTITKFQFRGTKGLLLVFDMCRRDSFDMLRYWLRSLEQEDLDAEQMILLANKSDMQSERQVSRRTAEQFAETHGMRYYETSAKSGQNVAEAFRQLCHDLVDSNDMKLLNAYNYTVQDLARVTKAEDEGKEVQFYRSQSFKLDGANADAKKTDCCKT